MNDNVQTKLFGAAWCEKTSAIKEFLDLQNVQYVYFDIEESKEAEEKVRSSNGGEIKMPLVIVKHSVLKNPSIAFLDQKLVELGIMDPS